MQGSAGLRRQLYPAALAGWSVEQQAHFVPPSTRLRVDAASCSWWCWQRCLVPSLPGNCAEVGALAYIAVHCGVEEIRDRAREVLRRWREHVTG